MDPRKYNHSSPRISPASLRQAAEEKARLDESTELQTLSLDDARQLFHELRVHQIELEMQNEELRRTQHELAISRGRYFDLYDLAPVGYLTLNEQGLVQDANLAAATMLGMVRKNLIKKRIVDVIFPEDQDVYYLHRRQVFESCELQVWEMRMLRADGSPFWARLQATPALNGEYWVTLVDNSDRKQAEDLLLKTNKLLSLFLKYSPIYAYIKEVTPDESRVLQASENFRQMTGVAGSEMVGKSMEELFPSEFAKKITADDWAVVTAGEVRELEEELDGRSYITVKFPINRVDKTLLAGYTIDITERKQAERVLQARLRISDYAFQHSLDELLTKVLDEAEGLTGSQIGFFHFVDSDQVTLSLQTWSSNTLSTICSAEGKGQHYPLDQAGVWADCIRERKALIHNNYDALPNRRGLPAGHAPVLRELVVPVFRNDLIVAVLGVGNKNSEYTALETTTLQDFANLAWDIITRKKSEEEMLQAKEAAETANRAKSEFLATMSHEIRTPLGAMLGNVELLEGTSLTPQQQEYLDDCKSASRLLLQVINDVLDFSKIEAGKLELVDDVFSIASMSRQLVRIFSASAQQKGLDLVILLSDDLPTYIRCDQQRLRQIISNLLSNAIKFTQHGTVTLKISCVRSTAPKKQDKALLNIVVKDTGIGIPSDRQAQIFESFTQVENFSTRTTTGTGLGLPICRRLLDIMGGDISVSSLPGQGSKFSVALPVVVCRGIVKSHTPAEHPAQPSLPFRKILLADDDQRGRVVAQKLLQRKGYQVTAVEDGGKLLDALQREAFDIVLTDISMPDMEGTQVARIIRSGERSGINPHIPIIAMTAHAFSDDRERFLAAGIDGYVAKPVNLDELLQQIERLCRRDSE